MNDLSHTIQTTYTYDSLNRLTAVEAEDGSALTYQYDKCGNPTVTVQKARRQEEAVTPIAPVALIASVAPKPPETSAKTVMMSATPMTVDRKSVV